MDDRFEDFIERILSHEGNYSDDPKDPGNWTSGIVGIGELKGTKFGIAANSFPHLSIKDLTRSQAIMIYKDAFWLRARCILMPPMVGFQLLDGAVNSGIPQAIRWMQRAVGVADDGKIGEITVAAITAADPNDVAFKFLSYRLDYMTRLKNWPEAGRGWARRIAANLLYASADN
jgi:lysozyme family protein